MSLDSRSEREVLKSPTPGAAHFSVAYLEAAPNPYAKIAYFSVLGSFARYKWCDSIYQNIAVVMKE